MRIALIVLSALSLLAGLLFFVAAIAERSLLSGPLVELSFVGIAGGVLLFIFAHVIFLLERIEANTRPR